MDPPNPVSTRCYIPELHSAVVQDANGKPIVSADIPVPEVRPGTILVRTLAVALMPADYKTGLAFPTPGAGIGMDFVGRVVKHGNEDDNTFHVGDVVCGTVPGSYPDQPWSGAFATFILAPTDLVLRVPDHMSPLDATGIGTPLLTCSMTLWGSLGSLGLKGTPTSPAAPEDSKLVLVYGGSTTCGTMAIQMLKL
jgi:NADPH:quinone reductase-like Zn-dependent oxidoreductase